MAKKQTKTIYSFQEKGYYNPEDKTIIGEKDGEVTDILELFSKMGGKEGALLTFALKKEDGFEDLEFDEPTE